MYTPERSMSVTNGGVCIALRSLREAALESGGVAADASASLVRWLQAEQAAYICNLMGHFLFSPGVTHRGTSECLSGQPGLPQVP